MHRPTFKGFSTAILSLAASMMGHHLPANHPNVDRKTHRQATAKSGLWWDIPDLWRLRKEQAARPCLHCGGVTKTKQPYCSAEHKKAWEAINPGKGRYVNETWVKLTSEDLMHPMDQSDIYQMVDDSRFMIKHNHGGHDDYMLHYFDEVAWQIVQIFDCLIDAQRHAAFQMRGIA